MPTIRDHFKDGDEFEDILDSAEGEARTGREQDFVADMRSAWDAYGLRAFMSEPQANWLRRIAKE